MGYEQKGSLVEMFSSEWVNRAGAAITERAGIRYLEHVRALTPVAKLLGGLSEQEMTDVRGGRKPGTLRDSIYLTPAVHAFGGWQISVATDDPIAIFVEWDTRPHIIEPKNAAALFWVGEGLTAEYASVVHHPGTKGKHMFQIGAMLTEAELTMIAEPIVAAAMRGEIAIAEAVPIGVP